MNTSTLLQLSLFFLPFLITIGLATSRSLADSTSAQNQVVPLPPKADASSGSSTDVTVNYIPYPKAHSDFNGYTKLALEVEAHRAKRLVDLSTFLAMSKEPGVIILDARTPSRYASVHVKGAVNLAFTEFTQGNLARVIPNPDTKILIYCNNNFKGDEVNLARKTASGSPGQRSATPISKMVSANRDLKTPLSLALNVPTYITLYGYGYRNVYELDELVDVKDARIKFESSHPDPNPKSEPSGGDLKVTVQPTTPESK